MTIESFDQWLEAWSIYEEKLMAINPDRYIELAQYRSIIQKANRKFQWTAVYDYNVQFRISLSENAKAGHLDIVDTTILDSSAVRKDGISCQRCKSEHHLIRECYFCPKPSLEENNFRRPKSTMEIYEMVCKRC